MNSFARTALRVAPLLLLPELCSAQTLSSIVGLFNIMVGLMLVAAFLLYGGGLVLWAVRLGTFPTNRDYAIEVMQWSVAVLFVLIILLAIVQFTQNYTRSALIIVAIILVFFVARLVALSRNSHEEEGGGGH
jgi:hypothetical protein